MRKLLFLSLLSFSAFSQEIRPLTYEGVFVTDKTKKEIYLNAREWFFENFNNYEGVISVEDYENGVFYSKGRLPDLYYVLNPKKLFSSVVTGDVKFSLRIYFKENKCKYVFDSFIHEDKVYGGNLVGTVERGFGVLTTSNEGITGGRGKVLIELKRIVDTKISDLTQDLKNKINSSNLNDY